MRLTVYNARGLARAIILASATIVVAYGAFVSAVVGDTWKNSPMVALQFDKNNALALAAYADVIAVTATSRQDILLMRNAAIMSLQTQVLNPRAIRQLATFDASGQRTPPNAGKLLDLSIKLSRREAGAQIMQIERLSTTDDISSVLQHYDVALTIDTQMREKLFPILASAIEDPAINANFAPYLSADRPWMPLFVRFKFDNDTRSTALERAALSARVKPMPGDFMQYVQYIFIRAIGMNRVAEARQLFSKYRIANPALLVSPTIAPPPDNGRSGVVAWNLFQDSEIASEFKRNDDSKSYGLLISVASTGSGVVASKLLALDPGRYLLNVGYGDVAAAQGTVIAWRMKCANTPGQLIIWQSTASSPQSGMRLAQSIDIPIACRAQTLELYVAASSVSQDNQFNIISVDLVPDRVSVSSKSTIYKVKTLKS